MNTAEYISLVRETAARVGAAVKENPILETGIAWIEPARVICSPIECQMSALAALHECGHWVLHREQVLAVWETPDAGDAWAAIPNVVDMEVEAWEWAREALGEALFSETQDGIRKCLDSYIEHVRSRDALAVAA